MSHEYRQLLLEEKGLGRAVRRGVLSYRESSLSRAEREQSMAHSAAQKRGRRARGSIASSAKNPNRHRGGVVGRVFGRNAHDAGSKWIVRESLRQEASTGKRLGRTRSKLKQVRAGLRAMGG